MPSSASSCFIAPAHASLRAHRIPSSRSVLPARAFLGVRLAPSRRPTPHVPPPRSRPAPHASASSSSAETPAAPPTPASTTALTAARGAAHQAFSLVVLLMVQSGMHRVLAALNITFPASLAAMLTLFTTMSLARVAGLSRAVDTTNAALFNPGVAFLTRWLAVFFVPNLVMLPLAPVLPGADLPKIGLILVGGFFASLFSSAAFCSLFRFLVRKTTGKAPATVPASKVSSTPPSNGLIAALTLTCALSLFVASRAANTMGNPAKLYALCATVLTFSIGQRFPKSLKTLLHPLVTCTVGTIGAMALLGVATGVSFPQALATYYSRRSGVWGGGNVLAALLGPAVITFAFTMDAQRKLALARVFEVVGTSLVATLAGLFGTAATARLLRLSSGSRLLVIPRMITAPLAVAIAELLGANVGLAASVVALTGLLGANIGATVLSAFKVNDPVVRGLAVGASAHGLGTAALSDEGSAFPFAALAMTLVGIFSTVLVAYAPFRSLLIRVALGKVCLQAPVAQ